MKLIHTLHQLLQDIRVVLVDLHRASPGRAHRTEAVDERRDQLLPHRPIQGVVWIARPLEINKESVDIFFHVGAHSAFHRIFAVFVLVVCVLVVSTLVEAHCHDSACVLLLLSNL